MPIITLLTLSAAAGAQSSHSDSGEATENSLDPISVAVESTTNTKSPAQSPENKSQFASVRGIVKDSSGRPIANATVVIGSRLPFTDIVARTNSTGEFFADSLNVGDSYSVAIISLGYRAFESKPFVPQERKPYSMNFVLNKREVVIRRAREKSKDKPSAPVVKQASEKKEIREQFISTQTEQFKHLDRSMK